MTYLELSVALGVLQHVQEELGALLGPAALSPAELFGLKKKNSDRSERSFPSSWTTVSPQKLLRFKD